MHKSQSLFYLTTALYVSGVTITHLQEYKTTVTTASGNNTHNRKSTMPLVGFEPAISAGELPKNDVLWWVHTCNVTAYRNTVS